MTAGPGPTPANTRSRLATLERPVDFDAAAALTRLLEILVQHFPNADVATVRRAYEVAAIAHAGQERKTGEPFISHPLAVAEILAELALDPPTICAALLHDVIEDTDAEPEEIEEEFGSEIERLVAGVTKISEMEAREKAAPEAESLRRMFLAAVDDLRVILIKLADRLHNMRTLHALPSERRREMARETLEIYAPLANRLGLWQLKSELEDRGLREIEPEAYASIEAALSDRRAEHETYLPEVIRQLEEALTAAGIESSISGRTKHFYSIYRKMQRKDVEPDEVLDVLAVRVLVDEPEQCYLVLGVVHEMWPPIDGEFDDYIAKPKYNLYQSLHTTVHGPGNRPVEVQIRTHEMHKVAQHGVAAHWLYKEGDPRARELAAKISALRGLLASHDEDATDAQAFVDGLRTDVFRDQVYVFTPQGDVMELPAGSTAVDFAYHIHTEVGHRCRGALVDGRMVSLDTQLETGQSVRVITAKGDAGPSRDWLNPALGYVASSRARSKIAQWFRRQARDTAMREGREVLERTLRKLGLTKVSQAEVARLFGYETLDDFLTAVGRNEVPATAIGARLLEEEEGTPQPLDPEQAALATADALRSAAGPAAGVRMRGADGVFTRVARCCRPLPGERVVGYITRGRGVTLHRADCRNIRSLRAREPERFIRVNWQQSGQQAYPVELRIIAYDRAGLVRDISDVIAQRGANMRAITAGALPEGGTAVVTAIVQLSSYTELSGLIDKLGTVDNVIEVRRPKG